MKPGYLLGTSRNAIGARTATDVALSQADQRKVRFAHAMKALGESGKLIRVLMPPIERMEILDA